MAVKKTGNTGLFMCQFLESRLDNVVYRLGFAPTRASARQLVCHQHINVNDKLVDIASLQLRPNDIVSFAKTESQKIPAIEKALENKDALAPTWLERKGAIGRLTEIPGAELIEKQIILRLVIEYFSR